MITPAAYTSKGLAKAFVSSAGGKGPENRDTPTSFGGGLAGGWALAREGSNPSPSARISPDNPRIKLPRYLYSPSCREGSFSETGLPLNTILGNSQAC